MDSLDIVEAVILIEEIFGGDIPSYDAESSDSPREIAGGLGYNRPVCNRGLQRLRRRCIGTSN
jgi:hypothetical protein